MVPLLPWFVSATLLGALPQDEAELERHLAERPSAAEVREARNRKREVVAAPDPDLVVDISDATFFDALDRRYPGMGEVRAHVDEGRVEEGWETLARYFATRWRARADVRQVVNYERALKASDRARIDRRAMDLGRGIVQARGTRYDLGEELDWARSQGQNDFAGLHYWEWAKPLWESYVRTGDEEYAQTFERLFRSWYAARARVSKVGDYDVLWYELGLAHRPMMLARLLYAMRASPSVGLEAKKELLKTLLGSANQLQAATECGYTDGNFQMYACNSLYQLGLCLPMFRDAARWRATAKRRLAEHVFWDFTTDGGHSERAHGYGQGTLLHVQKLLLHARDDPDPGPFGTVVADRVRAMQLWFLRYATPTGEFPGVNDSGFVDGAGWLQSLAWYAKDGRFLWPIRDRDGLPADPEPRAPAFGSEHLEADGWTILRDGWERDDFYLILNWGRWGSSHTHAALLDLSAYAFGAPMVVEGGHFGGYDNPLDSWFRGPEAHNQVVLRGRELDRRGEHGRVARWRPGETVDYWEAYHDGYRASSGRRLRRQVLFVKGEYWLVVDTLERRDRAHTEVPAAALLWHGVHPWRPFGGGLVSGAGEAPGVQLLTWPAIEPVFATPYENEAQELHGSRYTAAFGHPAVPGHRFVTVIAPYASTPVEASLTVRQEADGLAMEVRRGATRDHLFLSTSDGTRLAGGALRTDGVLTWLREEPRHAVVVDGTRVVWKDAPMDASEPVERLEAATGD